MNFRVSCISWLGILSLLLVCSNHAQPAAPAWWSEYGVLQGSAEDEQIALIGQAKYMAAKARDVLNEKYAHRGGAGLNIEQLVNAFGTEDNYEVLLIGQLKTIVAPFYQRLSEFGVDISAQTGGGAYPWTSSTQDDEDFSPALLGQVKYVFSFPLDNAEDSDMDFLPDAVEMDMFGNLDQSPDGDYDHDGISNIQEYWSDTLMNNPDSDGDGRADAIEIIKGTSPLLFENTEFSAFPMIEDFEAYDPGGFDPESGWVVEQGSATIEEGNAYEGWRNLKLLSTDTARLSLEFSVKEANEVWVDYFIVPEYRSSTNFPSIEGLEPSTFFFDASGHVVFFDPRNNEWVTVVDVKADFVQRWQHITLKYDYANQEWSIWLNGLGVAERVPFSFPTPYYSFFQITLHQPGEISIDHITVNDNHEGWSGFDYDFDFIPDAWELQKLGTTAYGKDDDVDSDGLSNLTEYNENTNPLDNDSDNDGVSDGIEVQNNTDPLSGKSFMVGFESEEGFEVGPLNEQMSWQVQGGIAVTTEDAFESAQSAKITQDVDSSINIPGLMERGNQNPDGVIWYSLNATLVAGELWDVSTSETFQEVNFQLDPDEHLQVFDGLMGEWIDTEISIESGKWNRYDIRISYPESAWDLFINGVCVKKATGLFHASSAVTSGAGVGAVSKNQSGVHHVYLDNFGVYDSISHGEQFDMTDDSTPEGTLVVGFEKNEGFQEGSLNGQANWVSEGNVSVSRQNAYRSEQSVFIAENADTPDASILFQRAEETLVENPSGVVWYSMNATLVAGDLWQSDSSMLQQEVNFQLNTEGKLAVYDGEIMDWVISDVEMTSGRWARYDIRIDYPNNTWSLYVNGVGVKTDIGLLTVEGEGPETGIGTSIRSKFATQFVYLDNVGVHFSESLVLDTDGDGIDDNWELEHFADLTVAGSDTDFDGDGYLDVIEYAMGTDPILINDLNLPIPSLDEGVNDTADLDLEGYEPSEGSSNDGLTGAELNEETEGKIIGYYEGPDGTYDMVISFVGSSGHSSYEVYVDNQQIAAFDVVLDSYYTNASHLLRKQVILRSVSLSQGQVVAIWGTNHEGSNIRVESIAIQEADDSWEDDDGSIIPPLMGAAKGAYQYIAADPYYWQAESAVRQPGLTVVNGPTGDFSGGKVVFPNESTWIRFDNVDLSQGIDSFNASASTGHEPNQVYLVVRIGSLSAEPILVYRLLNTGVGSWDHAVDHADQMLPGGPIGYYEPQTVYIQAHSPVVSGHLCDLDWVHFERKGNAEIVYKDSYVDPGCKTRKANEVFNLAGNCGVSNGITVAGDHLKVKQSGSWVKFDNFNFGSSGGNDFIRIQADLGVGQGAVVKLRTVENGGDYTAMIMHYVTNNAGKRWYSAYVGDLLASLKNSQPLYVRFENGWSEWGNDKPIKVYNMEITKAPSPSGISATAGIHASYSSRSYAVTLIDNEWAHLIENGDWLYFKNVNFGNYSWLKAKAAYVSPYGGSIDLYIDAPKDSPESGTKIGQIPLPAKGNWGGYESGYAELYTKVTGTHNLHLYFNNNTAPNDNGTQQGFTYVKMDACGPPTSQLCTEHYVGLPFSSGICCSHSEDSIERHDLDGNGYHEYITVKSSNAEITYNTFDFGNGKDIDYLRMRTRILSPGGKATAKIYIGNETTPRGELSLFYTGNGDFEWFGTYIPGLRGIENPRKRDIKFVFDGVVGSVDVAEIDITTAPRKSPLSALGGIQARWFWRAHGITLVGDKVRDIQDGDWLFFKNVDFGNLSRLQSQLAYASSAGAEIEFITAGDNTQSPDDGQIVGTRELAAKGNWNFYNSAELPLNKSGTGVNTITGVKNLYIRFRDKDNPGSNRELCRLGWVLFSQGAPGKDELCQQHTVGQEFTAAAYCPSYSSGITSSEETNVDDQIMTVSESEATVVYRDVDFGNSGLVDYLYFMAKISQGGHAVAMLYIKNPTESNTQYQYKGGISLMHPGHDYYEFFGAFMGDLRNVSGPKDVKIIFKDVAGNIQISKMALTAAPCGAATPIANGLKFKGNALWRSSTVTVVGDKVRAIVNGDWICFQNVNFANLPWLKSKLRFASQNGVQVEFKIAPKGTTTHPDQAISYGRRELAAKGNWTYYETEVETDLQGEIPAEGDLYVCFWNTNTSVNELCWLDWVELTLTEANREHQCKTHRADEPFAAAAYCGEPSGGIVCSGTENTPIAEQRLKVSSTGGSVRYDSFDFKSGGYDYFEVKATVPEGTFGAVHVKVDSVPVGTIVIMHPDHPNPREETFGCYMPGLGNYSGEGKTITITFDQCVGNTVGNEILVSEFTVKNAPRGTGLNANTGIDVDQLWRSSGITVVGDEVRAIEDGDWIYFENVNFGSDMWLKSSLHFASKEGCVVDFIRDAQDPNNPDTGIIFHQQGLAAMGDWIYVSTGTPNPVNPDLIGDPPREIKRLHVRFRDQAVPVNSTKLLCRVDSFVFKEFTDSEDCGSPSVGEPLEVWNPCHRSGSLELSDNYLGGIDNGSFIAFDHLQVGASGANSVEASVRVASGQKMTLRFYLQKNLVSKFLGEMEVSGTSTDPDDFQTLRTYLTEPLTSGDNDGTLVVKFSATQAIDAGALQSLVIEHVVRPSGFAVNDTLDPSQIYSSRGTSIKDNKVEGITDQDGYRGDYIMFKDFDFGNNPLKFGLSLSYSSGSAGGNIYLYYDDPNDESKLLAATGLPNTGSWDNYVELDEFNPVEFIREISGVHDIYFRFQRNSEDPPAMELFRLREFLIANFQSYSCVGHSANAKVKAKYFCSDENESETLLMTLRANDICIKQPSIPLNGAGLIGYLKYSAFDFGREGVNYFEVNGITYPASGMYIQVVISSDEKFDPASENNQIFGSLMMPGIGDGNGVKTVGGLMNALSGTEDLYLLVYGAEGNLAAGTNLFDFDWFRFSKKETSHVGLGMQVEAESYTGAHDVVDIDHDGEFGEVVSIDNISSGSTDPSDHIVFENFNFGNETAFNISGRYSSAYPGGSKIILAVKDPNNPSNIIPVTEVGLASTGSWDEYSEFTFDFNNLAESSLLFERDLYLIFDDRDSHQNPTELLRLDWFRIDGASVHEPTEYGLEMNVDAYNFSATSGNQIPPSDPNSENVLTGIMPGGWVRYDSFSYGIFGQSGKYLSVEANPAGREFSIDIYVGVFDPNSSPVGSIVIPPDYGWHEYGTTIDLQAYSTTEDALYLRFNGSDIADVEIKSFKFSRYTPSINFVTTDLDESVPIGWMNKMTLVDRDRLYAPRSQDPQNRTWIRFEDVIFGSEPLNRIQIHADEGAFAYVHTGIGSASDRDNLISTSDWIASLGYREDMDEYVVAFPKNGIYDLYLSFTWDSEQGSGFGFDRFHLYRTECVEYRKNDTIKAFDYCMSSDVAKDTNDQGEYISVSDINHNDYLMFKNVDFTDSPPTYVEVEAKMDEISKEGAWIDVVVDSNMNGIADEAPLAIISAFNAPGGFHSYGVSLLPAPAGKHDVIFRFRKTLESTSEAAQLPTIKSFRFSDGGNTGTFGIGTAVLASNLSASGGVDVSDAVTGSDNAEYAGKKILLGIEHGSWIRYDNFNFDLSGIEDPAAEIYLEVDYMTWTGGGHLDLYLVKPENDNASPWDNGVAAIASIALSPRGPDTPEPFTSTLCPLQLIHIVQSGVYNLYLRCVNPDVNENTPPNSEAWTRDLFRLYKFKIGQKVEGEKKVVYNQNGSMCMELRGRRYEDGGIVQQSQHFGMHPNQIWDFEEADESSNDGEPYFKIKVYNPGGINRYLSVKGDRENISQHTPVIIDSNTDPMLWTVEDLGGNTVIKVKDTSLVLQIPSGLSQVDEAPLEVAEYHGGSNQHWLLTSANLTQEESFDRPQNIMMRKDWSGKMLGFTAETPSAGQKVLVSVADGKDHQAWRFDPVGNGFYELHAKGDSQYLLESDNTQHGNLNIDLGDQLQQRWKPVPMGDGFVKFIPGHGPATEYLLTTLENGSFEQDWDTVVAPSRASSSDPGWSFLQHYYLQDVKYEGSCYLQNVQTGEILSITGRNGASYLDLALPPTDGSPVPDNAAWKIISAGQGYHRIVGEFDGDSVSLHRHQGGTANGTAIDLKTGTNLSNFHWDIIPISASGSDTIYKIVARIPNSSGEKVLTVARNPSSVSAITIEDFDAGASNSRQEWILTQNGVEDPKPPFIPRPGFDPTDYDRDMMKNEWEVDHGLNPYVNDAMGDLDGDHFPNIFEYARNSDPEDPGDTPGIDRVVDASDSMKIQQALDSAETEFLIIKLEPGIYNGPGNENLIIRSPVSHFIILCQGSNVDAVSIDQGFILNSYGSSSFLKDSQKIIGSVNYHSPSNYGPLLPIE